MGSLTITNVSGSPSALIRWGTDGLAFRTSGGQIFLVRTVLADDRNTNRLPDAWELRYFGSLDAPDNRPNDDPDGDDFSIVQEYEAGLNPVVFDPLQITQARMASGGGVQLSVLGHLGRSYALLTSTNLSNWTAILKLTCTNVPMLVTVPVSTNLTRCFYRPAPLSSAPGPRLRLTSPGTTGTNLLTLALDGVPGFTYRVDISTNLHEWTPLTNFPGTAPITYFQDLSVTNFGRRFYRAVGQ